MVSVLDFSDINGLNEDSGILNEINSVMSEEKEQSEGEAIEEETPEQLLKETSGGSGFRQAMETNFSKVLMVSI
jgi:hypothetical protein